MNRRNLVLAIGALVVGAFGMSSLLYMQQKAVTPIAPAQEANTLVRPYAPVVGPANAPVTIVEFFDPACETCRACTR